MVSPPVCRAPVQYTHWEKVSGELCSNSFLQVNLLSDNLIIIQVLPESQLAGGALMLATTHQDYSQDYSLSTVGRLSTLRSVHYQRFHCSELSVNEYIHCGPSTLECCLCPLCSGHPLFLTYVLLSLMALFKSYPSVGDLALPLSLLPLWSHTFRC